MAGTHIDHLALAAVDNFASQHHIIKLSSRISIAHFDALEPRAQQVLQHHLMEIDADAQTLNLRNFKTPTHALLYHFVDTVPDPFAANYDLLWGPEYVFNAVIDALKINKDGRIGYYPEHSTIEGIEAFKLLTDPPIFASRRPGITYQPLAGDLEPYVLDDDIQIRFVQEIMQTIHVRKIAPLKIALTRFARQFSRENRESIADRLLDTAIALEAIYLYNTSSELKYRLGLRLATHLGQDASQKQDLFDFVEVVYFVRSKIAHGEIYTSNEIKEKLKKDKEFKNSRWTSGEIILSELINVLRKSFRSILLDIGEKRFQNGFHTELDKATLLSGNFEMKQP